jgi:hypothetical protein
MEAGLAVDETRIDISNYFRGEIRCGMNLKNKAFFHNQGGKVGGR